MTEQGKGAGRPAFEPTEDQRKMVSTLSGYGLKQEEICQHITNPQTGRPISLKTLYEHFRDDLDRGMSIANAKVAESAFMQAVGRPAQYDEKGNLVREEQKPHPTMTIYWTKARMGWREPVVYELDWGPDEIDRAIKDAKARRAQREQAAADTGQHREAGGVEAASRRGEAGRPAGRNGQVRPLPN